MGRAPPSICDYMNPYSPHFYFSKNAPAASACTKETFVTKSNVDLAARLGGTLVSAHPTFQERRLVPDPEAKPKTSLFTEDPSVRRLATVTPAYEETGAIDAHQRTNHATLLTMSAMFLLVIFLFRRWAAKNVLS